MMVVLHELLVVASCSACLASAFLANAPAYSKGRVLKVAVESAATNRVRDTNPPQLNRLSSSRRRETVPPLLLSSRTVDVDVIDVTDVTEEEARREKEQVRGIFACLSAADAEHI